MNQAIAVILLALIAGAVLVLNQTNYIPGQAGPDRNGRDAYVDDMLLRVLNENGQPAYRLTAPRMTHYAGSGSLTLEQPELLVTRMDGSQWHATAQQGSADASGDHIRLSGSVVIQRLTGLSRDPVRITTSELLIKPAEKLAETDSTALISTDSYQLETVGLEANFNTNRVELRSRVTGRFDGNS